MEQALHSKIAGQMENTQPRSKPHSAQHTREMEESISAEGGGEYRFTWVTLIWTFFLATKTNRRHRGHNLFSKIANSKFKTSP